jgi:hypothetical protein
MLENKKQNIRMKNYNFLLISKNITKSKRNGQFNKEYEHGHFEQCRFLSSIEPDHGFSVLILRKYKLIQLLTTKAK